jgi:hypothetical protein
MKFSGETQMEQLNSPINQTVDKVRSLYLTKPQTKALFLYYFLLLFTGFGFSVAVFVPGPFSNFGYVELAFFGSASMACLGSAIFYMRKLYKAVLNNSLIIEDSKGDLKFISTFVYFFARPFFSISFALLIVIGVKSGLVLTAGAQSNFNYGFVQLTMFVSFFIGFLSGRFLRHLEGWGERVLEQVSKG